VNLIRALPTLYHPTLNPTGGINMGLAHNDLMQKELLEKVSLPSLLCFIIRVLTVVLNA
jgi:hypothetical protein